MPNDLERLTERRFDLLIVGGGIHGLFAAYDAAERGLSVALVERSDFGAGLTFNHQRTIHGGLRAMGSGRVLKARQQIAERRTWARIAPHLLRPLPFLIGTYGFGTRSRLAVRAGFKLYDLVGRARNRAVSPELHLPKGRLESAAATRRLFPGVAEAGLSGGAIWYDYQTRHADRLTWTVALAAEQAGAALANGVEAIGPVKSGARVTGARVRDVETGAEATIEAQVTLLAAGANLARLSDAFGVPGAPPLLRAMNVLLNRPARDIATAAPASSGRMLTTVPWRGYVLVGTFQSDGPIDPSESAPPSDAVDAFVSEINSAFPRMSATRRDIRLVHYGLTPAIVRGGRADLMPEPEIRRHSSNGVPGVISLIGVKYTTARRAAEEAVDAVSAEIGGRHRPSRTATTSLPYAGIADVEGRLLETLRDLRLEVDRDVVEHLSGWYGTEASDLVRFAADRNALERLTKDAPVLTGEILYAAEHARAKRLGDAVLRRTPLGSAGHPGRAALECAARIMAASKGWDAGRVAEEIAAVERVYPVPIAP